MGKKDIQVYLIKIAVKIKKNFFGRVGGGGGG